METFGQKVRQAVESQGLRLDEVAKATGLGIEHIRALERDDFAALPGDEILMEALRSFAQLVDVDPEKVIADYLRERQGWLATAPADFGVVEARDAREEPMDIDSPVAVEPSRSRAGRTVGFAILVSAILALAAVAFLLLSRPSRAPEPAHPAVAQYAAPPTDLPARPPDREEPVPAIKQPPDASGMSILEHGVGRGVLHHGLVGEAEQFAEGERVWFWTLIEGGTAGRSIEHVWLHDGKEALRVPLKLGGASWRTQSYKDLSPGSEGNWSVEARDEAGRVLARRQFLCSPR